MKRYGRSTIGDDKTQPDTVFATRSHPEKVFGAQIGTQLSLGVEYYFIF